jgi:hypothetical protein
VGPTQYGRRGSGKPASPIRSGVSANHRAVARRSPDVRNRALVDISVDKEPPTSAFAMERVTRIELA